MARKRRMHDGYTQLSSARVPASAAARHILASIVPWVALDVELSPYLMVGTPYCACAWSERCLWLRCLGTLDDRGGPQMPSVRVVYGVVRGEGLQSKMSEVGAIAVAITEGGRDMPFMRS